ncbi:FAD-dependent monooxygenase [Sphingobium phenoxybenzoativorans]|uniref:FAD-dependent monooxygenase n=1 Tax=Sphingobium phenoxybenzoativorans TaxID=1592790 RepID=UPI0008729499|nr:FAD-dependent monooxygenase [Sphingobium phenoxybenzoativorans]
MTRKRILIVGAGPTGLTLAILLRLRGFDPIVVERRESLTSFPAAHVINTRSQEILAEMGLAQIVHDRGDPSALSSLVAWVESMAGREYGILPIQVPTSDERGPLSAFCAVNMPQNHFEQLLYQELNKLGGSVRFGEEVTGIDNLDTGAVVTTQTFGGYSQTTIEADWVIGCDGAGSVVRRSLGIDMVGPRTIARFMTIYFRADLDRLRLGRQGLLYWIGGKDSRGVFICFDKEGRTWAMLVPIGEASLETFGEEAARNIVRKAIGSEEVPVELQGLSSWNMSAQVATSYRRGDVLLAGDACHRFPPTGGLGMNTGIQDAHNLAWKLSAVIKGQAPETLLDTYEQERRPVAQRNTDQSVHNLQKMGMIDEALGIQTLAPVSHQAGEGPITPYPPEKLGIDGGSQAAVARRALVQGAIDEQAEHFAQGAGIDLGFSYDAGAFIPDGSAPPSNNPCHYRPDAHPGARLPFASVDGSHAQSTLAAVRRDGITLFVNGLLWSDVVNQVSNETGIPIYAVVLDTNRFGPSCTNLLGINPGGAVAVRPDGHVLWRSRDLPSDPHTALHRAVRVGHGWSLQNDGQNDKTRLKETL